MDMYCITLLGLTAALLLWWKLLEWQPRKPKEGTLVDKKAEGKKRLAELLDEMDKESK